MRRPPEVHWFTMGDDHDHDHPHAHESLSTRIGAAPRRIFNRYLGWRAGRDRPGFYDVATHFPHLMEFDRNWRDIREEADRVLSLREEIPRYHEVDYWQEKLTGADMPGKSWKVFPLYLMGAKPKRPREMCPKTTAIIDRVPNLFQAMFSVLEPGKSIAPHTGPYLGYLRYHLGIRVPTENPPSIRVADEWYTWEEGKSVVLDDSLDHEVVNTSSEIRVVLIVDILRPFPPALHAVNSMLTKTVIRRVYAKRVSNKLDAIPFDAGLL